MRHERPQLRSAAAGLQHSLQQLPAAGQLPAPSPGGSAGARLPYPDLAGVRLRASVLSIAIFHPHHHSGNGWKMAFAEHALPWALLEDLGLGRVQKPRQPVQAAGQAGALAFQQADALSHLLPLFVIQSRGTGHLAARALGLVICG